MSAATTKTYARIALKLGRRVTGQPPDVIDAARGWKIERTTSDRSDDVRISDPHHHVWELPWTSVAWASESPIKSTVLTSPTGAPTLAEAMKEEARTRVERPKTAPFKPSPKKVARRPAPLTVEDPEPEEAEA